MSRRGPLLVMTIATLVLAGVLATFAIAIVRSAGDEREAAERRFEERAVVSAALTESLFASTAGQTARQLGEDFGEPEIDRRRLVRNVRRSGGTLFSVITDKEGAVLASTTDDPALAARVANAPSVVQAQGGTTYTLSDFLPDLGGPGQFGIVYSISFDTPQGRRVQAQVFGTALLSTFLGAYLARIPSARTTEAYILDSQGLVIATPVRDQPIAEAVQQPALLDALDGAPAGDYSSGDRHFASSAVAGSSWRVVLTTNNSDLYLGMSSRVEWLILVALAIAGAVTLLALYRQTRAAQEVQVARDRLSSANAELARSNLELQRSNAELEQFASVASHDLQEPLRKVQTFGDQLERRFGEHIPEEGIDYLTRMRKAAGRMSVLIDDLLRFSRVTTRAKPPESVDLSRIAREVVSDLETAIADAHAEVTLGPLPVVEADPSQMRQLLQNLIANAVKFTRPGVVPEIVVQRVGAPAGRVSFEVSDNGIGIEPEYAERIFRVFERLHPREVYEGTGIGLALCRKIAERHGGTVSLESEPGKGSRFVVELPAASQDGGSAPASPERSVASTHA